MPSFYQQWTNPSNVYESFFVLFFGGLEFVGLSCAYVALSYFREMSESESKEMGPYAVVDYNPTLCLLQSQLQHIYYGQPYARVDLNTMPESTVSSSQGLRIWPLDSNPEICCSKQARYQLCRDLGFGHWIRTQRAAVASRRATNFATHLPLTLATNLPT
jgi:hypothetical protein